jgi:hypothetical protein
MDFNYTHDTMVEGSSVVSEVVYDEQTRRLVVALHNGIEAGYENVDKLVYQSLVNADSVGAYWNRFVKNHFTGFDTSNLEYHDRTGRAVDMHHSIGEWTPKPAGNPEEVKVDPVNRRFEVSYFLDNTLRDSQVIRVNAVDTDSALVAFSNAAVTLGLDSVRVRSITLFFD